MTKQYVDELKANGPDPCVASSLHLGFSGDGMEAVEVKKGIDRKHLRFCLKKKKKVCKKVTAIASNLLSSILKLS